MYLNLFVLFTNCQCPLRWLIHLVRTWQTITLGHCRQNKVSAVNGIFLSFTYPPQNCTFPPQTAHTRLIFLSYMYIRVFLILLVTFDMSTSSHQWFGPLSPFFRVRNCSNNFYLGLVLMSLVFFSWINLLCHAFIFNGLGFILIIWLPLQYLLYGWQWWVWLSF